jgi:hypothetical protein
LVGSTKVDIFNERRIDASTRNGGANDMCGKVIGTNRGKRAAVTADRGSDGCNDGDSARHNGNLPQVSRARRMCGYAVTPRHSDTATR